MNKLFCYGITNRALQLLIGGDSLTGIPSAWFNFNTNTNAGRSKRLTLLNPEDQIENVLNWNRAANIDGYDCVLVYSTEDPSHLTDHADGLSDDVVLHPIYHLTTSSVNVEYEDVLNLLREPEDFFVNGWALVTCGGGVSIDHFGLAEVTMSQWWDYGLGLKKWINCTANGKPDSKHRQNCPDYAPWNDMKASGIDLNFPDTKLDIDTYWNASSSATRGWSISNACKPTDIPAMSNDGFIAYYPMRQMPCCGVAVKENGELVPFGALPDEKDISSNWVWDDGSIRDSIAKNEASSSKNTKQIANTPHLIENETSPLPLLANQEVDKINAWIKAGELIIRLRSDATKLAQLVDNNDGFSIPIGYCEVALKNAISKDHPEYHILQLFTLRVKVDGQLIKDIKDGSKICNVKIAMDLTDSREEQNATNPKVDIKIISNHETIGTQTVTKRIMYKIYRIANENLILQILPHFNDLG